MLNSKFSGTFSTKELLDVFHTTPTERELIVGLTRVWLLWISDVVLALIM